MTQPVTQPVTQPLTQPYDPELAPWAPVFAQLSFADIPAARAGEADLLAALPPYDPPVPLEVDELLIPGPEDAPEVRVRRYRPVLRDAALPGLVYFHGGGFVVGGYETHGNLCEVMSDRARVHVLFVDYRLAPEHPFPAGLVDCYAALELLAHLPGVDASRIAVHGASAGAALAAGVTLLSRDRDGPAIRLQSLNVPVLDDRLQTRSMTAFVDTPIWNRSQADKSWKHYLAGRPADGYAAPARTEDLSGLPPTYLVTGELDPLRDEGIAYATRLLEAGVSVELHQFPGAFHGSTAVPQAGISRRMNDELVVVLRRALSS